MPAEPRTLDLRRAVGWALVSGLCVAALTAVAALLTGDLGDTDGRVIVTSTAFSLFGALGAAGEALRRVARGPLQVLGAATTLAALAGFVLLLPPLWSDDLAEHDALWRAWGSAALLALAGSHASLVLRGSRPDDGALVAGLTGASLVAAAVDTALALAAILDVVEDPDEGVVRLGAVLLVVLVLTTALPPLLRRLARPAPSAPAALARELRAVADRLDALDASAGVHAEAARLRALVDDLPGDGR